MILKLESENTGVWYVGIARWLISRKFQGTAIYEKTVGTDGTPESRHLLQQNLVTVCKLDS